ncbi:MAG: hypothetical protein LBU53_05690 [Zoogloeaceae bacterium]|nr:hypothetical protein [Zoogloeaceae bacterium]
MKKIVSTFAAIIAAMFLFSPVAQAEILDELTAKNVKKEVLRVAKKYAEATSCIESYYNDYRVFEIIPFKQGSDSSMYGYAGEYGVIWDEGVCGVGTFSTLRIAFANIGDTGSSILVREDADFPDIPAVYCEKVISAKPDTIILECVTHRDDDANNFPTQKVAITFKRSLDKYEVYGKWKVLSVVKTGIIKHY